MTTKKVSEQTEQKIVNPNPIEVLYQNRLVIIKYIYM